MSLLSICLKMVGLPVQIFFFFVCFWNLPHSLFSEIKQAAALTLLET